MRKLKNHEKYRQALLGFAKSLNIKVVFKYDDGNGSYIPESRKIIIDNELTNSDEIATLLHELGHVLDEGLIKDSPFYNRLNKAYGRIYKKSVTKAQKALVIKCEKRAWVYGRAIANILGIKLGLWYESIAKQCIDAYRN